MARLIDADALGIGRCNPDAFPLQNRGYCAGWNGVIQLIAEAPTVDAVEVVRCKECIHWYEPDGVCLKIYSDGAVSSYAWQDRNPDDFCSYGERRNDD
jgi:hypothetical protein